MYGDPAGEQKFLQDTGQQSRAFPLLKMCETIA